MRRFAVLADDLTGASASAGALAVGLGMSIPVLEQIPEMPNRTLVLNTRSREDPRRRNLITAWVKHLWAHEYRNFDKRIDTTLRGPAPDELQLLLDALPEEPWIGVIAAYPSAGRTTRGGKQYLHGVLVSSKLPEVPTDDLGAYLFSSAASPQVISREALYRDTDALVAHLSATRRVCFDVTDDNDLVQIGYVLHRLRATITTPMVTVTSGALLEHYPGIGPDRVALVVGSPTVINLRQIEYLRRRRKVAIRNLSEPIDGERLPSIIVIHSGLEPIDAAHRQPLARALARDAKCRLDELQSQHWIPDRLIVTGGEMAQAFLDQIGAHGTNVKRLLSPLVAQGIIDGGAYDGREIVTKGGLVGDEALFHRLVMAPSIIGNDRGGSGPHE